MELCADAERALDAQLAYQLGDDSCWAGPWPTAPPRALVRHPRAPHVAPAGKPTREASEMDASLAQRGGSHPVRPHAPGLHRHGVRSDEGM